MKRSRRPENPISRPKFGGPSMCENPQRNTGASNADMKNMLNGHTSGPLTDEELAEHTLLEAASYASYLNQDEVELWQQLHANRGEDGTLGQRPNDIDEDTWAALTERDPHMQRLTNAGYEMRSYSADQGLEDGLAFMTLVDANREDGHQLDPILAFRGTEMGRGGMTAATDWWANLDENGIGFDQFENRTNQTHIQHALTEMGANENQNNFSVTGHSLGGALAESFTARYGRKHENITQAVTFNGAGVSEDVVAEFAQHRAMIPVHRHVTDDSSGTSDYVSLVGHHLPSQVTRHQNQSREMTNTSDTHTATPLADASEYTHRTEGYGLDSDGGLLGDTLSAGHRFLGHLRRGGLFGDFTRSLGEAGESISETIQRLGKD